MTEEEKLNAIKEDMQKGNSPFDADEVFNKKMECYPSNAADTLEETFKKRHSDLVCGKEPLSPYFDLFSEGYELAETEGEKNCKHLKSLLYCTVRSCNNCGKVNCENFQRQRIDCCGLWVSFKDYISKLETESAELNKKLKRRTRGNRLLMSTVEKLTESKLELEKENAELKGEANSVLDNWCRGDDPCPHLKKRDEQLTEAKEIINAFLDFEASAMERGCYIADDTRRRAEDFIKE